MTSRSQRNPYGAHWQRRVRPRILLRDRGNPCPICHRPIVPWEASVDHIVPISRGGSWFDVSNLRMACQYHERQQGGRLGAEASGWPNLGVLGSRRSRRSKRVWLGAIDLN